MGNAKFRIFGIQSGDLLNLTDNGNAEIKSNTKYRNITWALKTEKVQSFRIQGKTTHNPFVTPIPTDFRSRVQLKVKEFHEPIDWDYSILWIDAAHGNMHTHDPKIAIRSSFTPLQHKSKMSWKQWLAIGLGALALTLWLTDDKKEK